MFSFEMMLAEMSITEHAFAASPKCWLRAFCNIACPERDFGLAGDVDIPKSM